MIALLLDALACFRITKLVTHDTLTVEAREALIAGAYRRAGREAWAREQLVGDCPSWAEDVVANDCDPPKWAVLVSCPWCSGMWIALGVVALRRFVPRWWAPLGKALALSAAAGLTAENLQKS